jgi:hypothetical protein
MRVRVPLPQLIEESMSKPVSKPEEKKRPEGVHDHANFDRKPKEEAVLPFIGYELQLVAAEYGNPVFAHEGPVWEEALKVYNDYMQSLPDGASKAVAREWKLDAYRKFYEALGFKKVGPEDVAKMTRGQAAALLQRAKEDGDQAMIDAILKRCAEPDIGTGRFN